nr:type II secretion system protein GspG [Thauera sp.]
YLRKAVPADPWGNAYRYRHPGEHGEYDIFSYGADGQPGGDATSADITNW